MYQSVVDIIREEIEKEQIEKEEAVNREIDFFKKFKSKNGIKYDLLDSDYDLLEVANKSVISFFIYLVSNYINNW